MTRGQVSTWVRETEAMWGMLGKFRQQVEQLHATLPLLQASGNAEQYVKAEREHAAALTQCDQVEAAVLARLNARDTDTAEQGLVDLRLRADQMNEAFIDWRTKVQRFELAVVSGQFADPNDVESEKPTRAMGEAVIAEAKQRYEQSLALVDAGIPNQVVLIHA